MSKLSQTALRVSIQKENERFNALSRNEKRVEIARDVIAQLASKRFEALRGTYVESLIKVKNAEQDLSEAILGSKESCTVCGIGGFFISAVCKADNLPAKKAISDFNEGSTNYVDIDGDKAYSYLRKFFSKTQLELIECAFEQSSGFSKSPNAFLAANFGKDVEDDDDRLRLIAENVVANKGRFVPRKKPVMVWQTPGYTF